MNLKIASLALLLAASSPKDDLLRGVATATNRGSTGHACPISDTVALSAEHVTSHHGISEVAGGVPLPTLWVQGAQVGTMIEVWSDARRDLSASESLEGKFGTWYKIAEKEPEVGDWVLTRGFKPGFQPTTVRSKIVWGLGGIFVYEPAAGLGSSGSCVVLEKTGEVVGIAFAMVDWKNKPGKYQGLASSVWGDWLKVHPMFLETVPGKAKP